jgi:glycosyltransferase involved in cell wall biosynthesis
MAQRLLFLVNDAGFFLSHRLPLALAARAQGYDVHVATAPGPKSARIEQHGLPWHAVPMSRSGKHPVQEARTVASLVQLYRRLRPQLLHHVTPKAVLYGSLAARVARVPAVVNALTGLGYAFQDERRRGLMKLALGAAFRTAFGHPRMRVIFQNADDQELFVANGWLQAERTVLIPGSGVDTAVYRPRPEARAAAGGRPAVLFASRLLWSKGVGQYVEAARALQQRGVDARFLLAGAPDLGNPDTVGEAQLQEWAAAGTVEYLGQVGDMPALFASADVACLPTYYREGVPKFLIEAGACGLPSVTTDVPGCRDLVLHGTTGLVVPRKDAGALASALHTLLTDAPLRARMGEAARQRIIDSYSLERVIGATLSVYAELSAPTPGGAASRVAA